MPITCPNCSHINPDQSVFCIKCGNNFQTTGPINPTANSPTYLASMPAPPTPSYSPPPSPSIQSPSSQQRQSTTPSYSAPMQMGTGQGQFSLRRAFAGHGTSIMHYSWLLDGRETQASTVLSAILQTLRQRNIVGLDISSERLIERGILMEERDYLKVRRGVSTVFIYVAPAGHDLYISRATNVLPAIDTFRVVGLLLLLALALFGPGILQGLAGPTGYLLGGLFGLIAIPIWLFFIWLLFRSFAYWMIEKDFWVYLRSRTLNDFQLDDIALLEHVTDDTVHDAVGQLGLDASKIIPPAQGYQPKPRIRAI